MTDLAGKVAQARKRKGWTQEQLAEHIGMSVDWVRKVEGGRSRRPQYDSLLRTASALDLEPTELIPGYKGAPIGEVEYLPLEQVESINASLRSLRKMSPEGLRAAEKFLETFARMDEDEFQNKKG